MNTERGCIDYCYLPWTISIKTTKSLRHQLATVTAVTVKSLFFVVGSNFMAASEFYVRIFLVKTRCKEEECARWARLCPRERGRGRGGAGERRPRGTLRLHHSPGGGAPRLFSPLCSLVTFASLLLIVCFDGLNSFIPSFSLKSMNPLRRK